MRITLIDPSADGHHVGYAASLCRGLHKSNHKVYMVGNTRLVEQLGVDGLIDGGVSVGIDASRRFTPIERTRFLNAALKAAERLDPDIIHLLQIDRFVLNLAAIAAIRKGEIPLRATLHWTYFLPEHEVRLQRRIAGRFEVHAFRSLMFRYNSAQFRVMVHSKAMMDELERTMHRQRFDYVPYPWNLHPHQALGSPSELRNKFGITTETVLILCFGGTRWDKGVDLAVKMLSLLPERFHLVVAGISQDFTKDYLEKEAKKYGVQSRIHLQLSFIPDEEVYQYFRMADIVLLPYRREFSGQSGPLSIAAALGRPIVAADLLVLAETVARYDLGETFPPEDVRGMADAILRVSKGYHRPNIDGFAHDHSEQAFIQAVKESYSRGLQTC